LATLFGNSSRVPRWVPPPAPPWANIYYSLCEGHFLSLFQENLLFYKRFIDDVLGIWIITDPVTNSQRWASFQRHTNEELYGLEWIVSRPSQKVDLYIPPHSSQPPGLLRGMVHGMLNRIHTLCSAEDDKRAHTITFFRHLQCRGYQPKNLIPLFSPAIKCAREYADSPPCPASQQYLKSIQFFHLEYHQNNIASSDIRSIWQNHIASPPNKEPLSELENFDGKPCAVDRLILNNHIPPKLSNFLCYRKLKPNSGPPV
jgi:hypothetical protein